MNIIDLKNLIKDLPDNMQVIIPGEPFEGFTGFFFSPCIEESQPIEMGTDEDSFIQEMSFALVPCGFYDKDHTISKLN